jgi:RNA polymerase sigma-70 factor (ECF subfamily)
MLAHDRFNRLSEEARPRLLQQALFLSRNAELAQDLVQAALVKAARNFYKFDGDRGSFLTWTLRILQRIFLDDVRWRSKRPVEISFEGLGNLDTNIDSLDFKDENTDVLRDVIAKEERAQLEEMLNSMQDIYAEALRLHIMEGLSYEEVAARQGATLGTVRSRIHRAKKILCKAAEEQRLAAV